MTEAELIKLVNENTKGLENQTILWDKIAYELNCTEFNTLREFVMFIRKQWVEEVNVWQEAYDNAPSATIKDKINCNLVTLRKVLGNLDDDLQLFLEEKIHVSKNIEN